MTPRSSTFPLRLPASLKSALEQISKEEGTSINQFVVTAVAEKISALKTATFFDERRPQANLDLYLRILNRPGGEPPRPGDEA